jgi:heat shock protein HtpX
MKRILLFLLTNLAVLVVLTGLFAVLHAFGILRYDSLQGYAPLLVFAAVIGFAGSIVSLLLSKSIAKWSTGAQVITHPQTPAEAWLLETVAALAQRAGIGMPEVAIFPSHDLNAFATGANRNRALVAVSTGLLEGMRRDEVEAVLAHEVAHVANGDMITMALLQGVLNTFVIFVSRVVGSIVDSWLRGDRESRGLGIGYWLTVIVAEICLGLLATVIAMWFSRQREFRADAGSARLVGAHKLIAALQRLRADREPPELPQALRAFGIRGSAARGLMRLFLSHPPLEERIQALQGVA